MHRHDLDLIAGYAGGDLTNEAKARDLISKCKECAAEYHLQQSVAADLRQEPTAALTEIEKAELHRDLWAELSSSGRETRRSQLPNWMRLSFGAAAAFALLVGTLAVLSNVGSFDDGAGEPFAEIGSSLGSDDEEPVAGEGNALVGGADGGASRADTTTAAESPTDLDDADGVAEAEPRYLDAIDSWRKSRATTPYAQYSPASVEDTVKACLIEAGLEGYQPVGEIDSESEFLLAVPEGAIAAPDVPVTVVDPGTCEIIHTDG